MSLSVPNVADAAGSSAMPSNAAIDGAFQWQDECWSAREPIDADFIEVMRAIFDNGTVGVAELDINAHRFTRVNRAFCVITGRTEQDLLAKGPTDIIYIDDHADLERRLRANIADSGTWDAELRYIRPDQSLIWARISVAVSKRDAAGGPLRLIGIIQDITESKLAAERLRASEELTRLAMENARIGTFRREFPGGTMHCGPEMRALCGLPPGNGPMPADEWFACVVPEDRARFRQEIDDMMAQRVPFAVYDYRIRHPVDGRVHYLESRTHYSYDHLGRPFTSVGVVIDVTERREAEARITHLALHDPLTDLPNRVLFRDRVEEALARRRDGFAVLCLDLDHFKQVNDTLGHPAGDALLRAVTTRLKGLLAENDTLARLSGDEFAILQFKSGQPCDATLLAIAVVDALAQPFTVGGDQVTIGVSVGVAFAPTDGQDVDTLLKSADTALYGAKADGRGVWRLFEPEMNEQMQRRRTMDVELRRAIEHDEFILHYQPILEVASGRITGMEALLRWRHPERGLVGPDAFIPIAEENATIIPIGRWVLHQACADAMSWPGSFKIAINLSPVQFGDRQLVDVVAYALRKSGLDPRRLELEITETALLRDTALTLATLRRLKALGVRIAMDDFGTGYSSLSYLQRFPFDKVKIDRCFIRELGTSHSSDVIVRSITALCTELGITTTAEGVETEAQLAALRTKQCTEAQGYLFRKPGCAADIAAFIADLAPGERFRP